jgi:hypothetical protein
MATHGTRKHHLLLLKRDYGMASPQKEGCRKSNPGQRGPRSPAISLLTSVGVDYPGLR